ncbi:hypothetical protein KBY66_00345 [Synechococcus sp. Tobar12-5m-g]|uniref:hypothetical protein n=1 Tax=unclassified Synechococcus TaxID=2626047 RepID=UPI0020CFE864|nr:MULTISPECIES: hypothetical protein [unclassified Synechococcus]MCP9771084.1 hypothetical protein [Synechococcus sp. Tobar12-5m-g]MCP9872024.1 hypothetical protein [Synechococcus sp. Cruz CV-v-12]
MTSAQDPSPTSPAEAPHNFAVQKELHRQIRNDPDYDDWEYGTEPLPQEQGGWVARPPQPAGSGSGDPPAAGVGVEAP